MGPSTTRLALPLSLTAALMIAAPRSADACAAGAVSASGDVGADAQRIFIAASADKTDVVVQATVPSSREAYGILIPLPVEPTLDPTPVDTAELDQLDTATRPAIVDNTSSSSGGVGCGSAKDLSAGGGRNGGVDVVESVTIGPLAAVVLTASSAASLETWLSDNGFVLPSGASALVARYTKPGSYFIAAKRADTATSDAPSSLGVHFTLPGEQLTIPVPIAALGTSTELAFAIFVAHASPVGPLVPYTPLGLGDLDATTVRTVGYRAGITAAVAAKSGRAFVSEGVYAGSNGALTGRLASFAPASAQITRLTTVTTPGALTDDLVLSTAQAPSLATRLDVTDSKDDGGCTATSGIGSPLVWAGLLAFFFLRARRARP